MNGEEQLRRPARPRARLRFGLKTFLLLPVLAGLLLAGIYGWPRSRQLDVGAHYVGHYRGLGLAEGTGFLGRNYFRFTIDARGVDPKSNYWEIDFRQEGYNPFRQYYANGALAEEGECLVTFWGGPTPDYNDVRWSKSYRPDGSLGSEVRDGTGTQTGWYPGGGKAWELELRDYRRVQSRSWHENGQLRFATQHLDDRENNPFQSYFENGQLKAEGKYFKDRYVVKLYDETGALKRRERHTSWPPRITKYKAKAAKPASAN